MDKSVVVNAVVHDHDERHEEINRRKDGAQMQVLQKEFGQRQY